MGIYGKIHLMDITVLPVWLCTRDDVGICLFYIFLRNNDAHEFRDENHNWDTIEYSYSMYCNSLFDFLYFIFPLKSNLLKNDRFY